MPVQGEPSGDGERAFGPMQARKISLLTGADDRAADPVQLGAVQTRRLPADAPDALGVYRQRSLTAEVRRAEGETRTTVVINTAAVDNHRTIIDPAGGEWDEFRHRFLINHDPNLLAGESPTPELRDGQWVVSVDDDAWDHDDPQITRWFNKVKRGLCREISLGFRPIDGRWETVEADGRSERVFRFTRWKGLEWSFVGLASNAEAVVTERSVDQAVRAVTGAVSRRALAAAEHVEDEAAEPVRVFTPAEIREAAEARRQRLRRAALAKRGQA